MEITYITSNPNKAKQLSWHLGFPVIHQSLDLPEIQSLSIDEVVQQKAKTAYELIGKPVLIEDYSLVCNALGKLPGPLVKWFILEIGTSGICKLLDGYTDRSAVATSASCLYDGATFHIFKGKTAGTIASQPRGKEVFGTDTIFIPQGQEKTWSEMTKDEQLATSIRRKALKQLEKYLHQVEKIKIN